MRKEFSEGDLLDLARKKGRDSTLSDEIALKGKGSSALPCPYPEPHD